MVAVLFISLLSNTAFAYGTQPSYTISYNANGGWNAPASQTKSRNSSITVSAQTPVRTGYDFAGWRVDLYTHRYVADFGAGSTLYMDASNSVYPPPTLPSGYDAELRSNTVRGLVKRLYFYSYNRLPSDGELNHWVTHLVNRTANVEDLANALFCDVNVQSKYCASCFVDRLYASLLNRDPDFPGKCDWVRKCSENNGYERTVDGCIGSTEFIGIANRLGIRTDIQGIAYPSVGSAISDTQCINYDAATHHHKDIGYPFGTRRYGVYSTQGTVMCQADNLDFIVYRTNYLDGDSIVAGSEIYHKTILASIMNENRGVKYFSWLIESLNPRLLLNSNIQPAWLDADYFDSSTNCFYMVRGNIYVNRWLGVDDNSHIVADPPQRYLRTAVLWQNSTYPAESNSIATLYAQWKEKTYTVTYSANGGNNAPSAQTKYHTKSLALSSEKPTREGYTFTNWNTSPNGTGQSYASGAVFDTNANVTLYAQWSLNNAAAVTLSNAKTGSSTANETPCNFEKLQKGVLDISLVGKVSSVTITFPTELTASIEGWELLQNRILTLENGLTSDERQQLKAEFYIPVNFDIAAFGDKSLPIKIFIVYANGETKEITRNINIPKNASYLFKTNLLS